MWEDTGTEINKVNIYKIMIKIFYVVQKYGALRRTNDKQ
jgi:hypothetical protein